MNERRILLVTEKFKPKVRSSEGIRIKNEPQPDLCGFSKAIA
ncbi:hypothetical protein KKC1_00280 [Calderihabitans maritimus]|uniref:Uncharacterized protein n=1 Tax=Calderihabitans maritimus TaxID=1246530 RepID=A0A1Z5HMW2_9FIRM|nr:hypothetical protein KKC1_00280 [Calderihabitans maritimus]